MVDTSVAEYDYLWLAEHENGLSEKKVCLPSLIDTWLAEYEEF